MKASQTLYISSLMYLESFWLRNMHLKVTFSMYVLSKIGLATEREYSVTRPTITRLWQLDVTSLACFLRLKKKVNFYNYKN